MADTLSFERAFWYRVGTLAAYAALFYVLSDVIPGGAAFAVIAGASFVTALGLWRWRDGNDWLEAGIAAIVCVVFCGLMTVLLTQDDRDTRAPDWALALFTLCCAEATFFALSLGAFGAKFADPVLAIVISLFVFAVQAIVFAVGMQVGRPRPAE